MKLRPLWQRGAKLWAAKPLSIAAEGNPDPKVVAMFLARGRAPDVPDDRGITPLMYAAEKERIETVRLLIKAGARVNHQSMNGLTALHLAVGNNTGVEVARMLLAAGADVGLKTPDGLSVHDAIMRNPALKANVLAEEIYWKSPGK